MRGLPDAFHHQEGDILKYAPSRNITVGQLLSHPAALRGGIRHNASNLVVSGA